MSKYAILTVVLHFILSFSAQAQVLTLDHGKITFHTSSIMSDIEAITEEFEVSLDIETGAFKISIPISTFEFEYEMMQEHFNEDYIESHLYPDATFVGKITEDISDVQESMEIEVKGQMTIHGVTQSMNMMATLSPKDDFTKVKCIFPIVFKDFKVKEPAILSKSVAKDVEVKGILYLK